MKKKIVIGVIVIMSILGFGSLSSYKEINEEKHFTLEEINEIQVNMSSEPVRIIRTEASSEVKFHYYGKNMQDIKLTSELNNKTVVVEAKRRYPALPIPEDMVLDIYIPEKYEKNLSIKTSSGNVKMDSFNLTNFTFNISSGKLEAENLNAEKIFINTSSGDLKIKKLDAKKLEIKSSAAAININECIVKSGRIETVSGNITLKNSSGNFDFKSTSGSVLVAYKEFVGQNINIETSSGSVTLELPHTSEFLIETKTSSGSFQSDFPIKIAENTNKKNIKGQIGTKNNKVLIQTSSGNMKILKK